MCLIGGQFASEADDCIDTECYVSATTQRTNTLKVNKGTRNSELKFAFVAAC